METVEHYVVMKHAEGLHWPCAVFHTPKEATDYLASIALDATKDPASPTFSIEQVIQPTAVTP